jgi:predicted amidohydrolase
LEYLEAFWAKFRQQPTDELQLTTAALRFCREHAQMLRTGASDDFAAARTDALREFTDLLQRKGDGVDEVMLGELERLSHGAVAGLDSDHRKIGQAVVLRCLAQALGTVRRQQILELVEARGIARVSSGDFVPFRTPFRRGSPFFQRYKGRLGTHPDSTDEGVDRLPGLGRLVPEGLPCDITINFRCYEIDRLTPDSTIACAIPSGRAEVVVPPPYRVGDELRFFGVRPNDTVEQTARALRLVEEADNYGAHLVVLPEASLDPSGQEAVAEWVRQKSKNLVLAVCGSTHAQREGKNSNTSLVVTRHRKTSQSKMTRYAVKLPGHDDLAWEDIDCSSPELVIYQSSDWSVAIAICKDFITPWVKRILEDLRVSLVLVPACSPRTSDFLADAAAHVTAVQGHVVAANLCDVDPTNLEEKPQIALFARPVRGTLADIVEGVPRGGSLPPLNVVKSLTGPGLTND